MERRPISILTWDPRELYWKVWMQDHIKYVPFFQNSVKIGRKILGATSWKEPTVNVVWRWTFSTTSQTILEMAMGYKIE